MRYKNLTGEIKLYAVAGTQTVLLAFDIAEAKVKGTDFLGFSVERVDKNGNKIYLNGSKHFDSLMKDNTITDPKIKFTSLVQAFFWKDYVADPGEKYTYTVKAKYGTPVNFRTRYENSITVITEELHKGKHSVYFNYGVTGSQGYASNKEFGNKPVDELPPAIYKKALDYLSRELYNEGLMEFLNRAKTKKHSLYCAFYEIQFPAFIKELKEVKAKCKDLQIVYSGQSGQNKKPKDPKDEKGNLDSLKNAGLLSISHKRTKANQPHNKFMILCKDDKPIEVWTGSTNITLSGIFGQCNTGHWIKDAAIARKYKKYWDHLQQNPALGALSKTSEEIQPGADLSTLENGTYVFFSPRNLPAEKDVTPAQLKSYVDLIDKAEELVCMIFPFNYDEVFKKVYDKDRGYLRLLLFEKTEQAKTAKKNEKNDVDLKVTAGAVLKSKVETFVKEETAKKIVKGGILYVHNKFFLVDPLGNNPYVLTGSANFSNASITSNDENSLLIKGDARVADIYLTEFNRLFEHFWPRYLTILNNEKPKSQQKKEGFDKPLDEKYTWFNSYYDEDSYHHKRGQLFIKMKGVKKG